LRAGPDDEPAADDDPTPAAPPTPVFVDGEISGSLAAPLAAVTTQQEASKGRKKARMGIQNEQLHSGLRML
jgi:hypothetical protein